VWLWWQSLCTGWHDERAVCTSKPRRSFAVISQFYYNQGIYGLSVNPENFIVARIQARLALIRAKAFSVSVNWKGGARAKKWQLH
jgi:hypothetical protein